MDADLINPAIIIRKLNEIPYLSCAHYLLKGVDELETNDKIARFCYSNRRYRNMNHLGSKNRRYVIITSTQNELRNAEVTQQEVDDAIIWLRKYLEGPFLNNVCEDRVVLITFKPQLKVSACTFVDDGLEMWKTEEMENFIEASIQFANHKQINMIKKMKGGYQISVHEMIN